MLEVNEYKSGKVSKFSVVEKINNKILSSKIVEFPLIRTKFRGKNVWVLYDDNLKPIPEFYKYINHEINELSNNTIKTYAYQLKNLYVFCNIFNVDIKKINYNDASKLLSFCRGCSTDSENYKINLKTDKLNSSVLTELNVFCNYCFSNNFDDSSLNRIKRKYVQYNNISSQRAYSIRNYENKKHYKKIPLAISFEEIKKIFNYIDTNIQSIENKLRDKALISVMFFAGLRPGEAFSLTLEDIKYCKTNSGFEYGVLRIRNRLSNKDYQCAKKCMKIKSASSYNSKNYYLKDYGYQDAPIPIRYLDILNEYIDVVHGKAKLKPNRDRYKKSLADSVENNNENHYVFLNRYYGRLSIGCWNIELRKIFSSVGIEIDHNSKKHNLSHRFRHGFATYLIKDLHMEQGLVSRKMRHKNITSTDVYFNPTEEELMKMREEIETDFLKRRGLR